MLQKIQNMLHMGAAVAETITAEPTETRQYPAIVTKIHREFNGAADEILAEAKSILEKANSGDARSGEALRRLGFISTPQALAFDNLQKEKKEAENATDQIFQYRKLYPKYKFITEKVVQRICEKYSLVLGEAKLFKGFVPQDKVREMLAFKVEESHILHKTWSIGTHGSFRGEEYDDNGENALQYSNIFKSESRPLGFHIVAPVSQMNMSGQKLSGYKIILSPVPDPVVLQPVIGGYFVVCAWGNEAADPAIK